MEFGNKKVVNVHELADILGISRPLAYEIVRRADFPAVRLSERRIVVPVDALNRWLDEQSKHSV